MDQKTVADLLKKQYYQDFNTDAMNARNAAAKVTANKFLHQGLPNSLEGLGPTPKPNRFFGGGVFGRMPYFPDRNPNQPGMQQIPPMDDTPLQQIVPWTPKYLLDALKGPGWESTQPNSGIKQTVPWESTQ